MIQKLCVKKNGYPLVYLSRFYDNEMYIVSYIEQKNNASYIFLTDRILMNKKTIALLFVRFRTTVLVFLSKNFFFNLLFLCCFVLPNTKKLNLSFYVFFVFVHLFPTLWHSPQKYGLTCFEYL
jgi:hypothetical protein